MATSASEPILELEKEHGSQVVDEAAMTDSIRCSEGNLQEFSQDFVTDVLRKKFDEGLQSTSVPYHQQISEVALQLNISTKKVKDFIGNERKRRKRKDGGIDKPPSKIRSASGYNLFVGDFLKSDEGKSLPDVSTKNKVAAKKWNELELECQLQYNSQAVQKSKDTTPDSWKETRRILENMKENVT